MFWVVTILTTGMSEATSDYLASISLIVAGGVGVLGVVFWLWYRSEGTLPIHSIVTRRRETYYWITVLATFALGTAAGDLTASA